MILNTDNTRLSTVYVDGCIIKQAENCDTEKGTVGFYSHELSSLNIECFCIAKESIVLEDIETGKCTVVYGRVPQKPMQNGKYPIYVLAINFIDDNSAINKSKLCKYEDLCYDINKVLR